MPSYKMSKQDIVMQIPCNPEIFGTTTFPVTMYKKTLKIRPKSKPFKAMTLGEEIDALVKEWYAERGLPVPAGELIGAQIADSVDAEQKVADAQLEKFAQEVPAVAPSYGTPEFWAYHRAKKAAENKRREAEGLPPLPTKKELEAEKAKKKAEREAAKATKEAAKQAKEAAKKAKA
jgi:hypothetical protein